MNLNDYETRLAEITASALPPAEQRAALELLATELDGCAWQPWARERARALAAQARQTASTLPEGGLDALSRLAGKGLLRRAT